MTVKAIVGITAGCKNQLIHYCTTQFPYEACGLLIAANDSQTITEIQPIINRHKHAEHAFLFDSTQWVKHYFDVMNRGYSVVGIFHSHPLEEAIPSKLDVDGFFDETMIYAIVSLKQKDSPQLRFYRYHAMNEFIDYPLMLT